MVAKRRNTEMTTKDGRAATQPYRVRVGNVWYWVDPTVPAGDIEPGDTVVVYPAAGGATLAILQRPFKSADARSVDFSSLEGERFTVPAGDIAALHLAAVDDDQT
jgi:hypothetical protein